MNFKEEIKEKMAHMKWLQQPLMQIEERQTKKHWRYRKSQWTKCVRKGKSEREPARLQNTTILGPCFSSCTFLKQAERLSFHLNLNPNPKIVPNTNDCAYIQHFIYCFYILCHLILTIMPWVRSHFYSHFEDEEN